MSSLDTADNHGIVFLQIDTIEQENLQDQEHQDQELDDLDDIEDQVDLVVPQDQDLTILTLLNPNIVHQAVLTVQEQASTADPDLNQDLPDQDLEV